jgi:hypothetical protein
VGAYRVTDGYVTVETAVGPGRAQVDILRGARVPDDVPAEQVAGLLRDGRIAEEAAAPVEVDPNAVPDGSASAVLEWVGTDKDRASRALEAEQAKGDQARKGLTADLSKLIDA